MSSEIIPNSIISFISAQLTQILGVLITTGKPAKWRPELDGENGNANTGSRNRPMKKLSRSLKIFPDLPQIFLDRENYYMAFHTRHSINNSPTERSHASAVNVKKRDSRVPKIQNQCNFKIWLTTICLVMMEERLFIHVSRCISAALIQNKKA